MMVRPKSSPAGLTVGLLPLFLQLYDETRPDMRDHIRPIVDSMTELLQTFGTSVVEAPIVTTTHDVVEAMSRFDRAGVDLIATLHLAYSPSLLVADVLTSTGKPILVIDSTISPTFDSGDPRYLLNNHGIHGVMDLTSVLRSRGVYYTVVAGHADATGFRFRLKNVLSAYRFAKLFRNQCVGVTGAPFSGMGDFAIDRDALTLSYGIQALDIDPDSVIDAAEGIDDKRVDEMVSRDRSEYDTSAIVEATHRREVRIYLALF